jgi:hypothetical protein
MKRFLSITLVVLAALLPGAAESQTTNLSAEAAPATTGPSWDFYASVYGYLVPDSRDYVNPNFTADRGWLHLEGRYNYEAFETGSLWAGYNFQFGSNLVFQITPMLGVVFGDLTGIAPGYNYSLTYKKFSLTSQGEYVFDVGNSSGNYFYTWSELTYSPWDWLHAGIVAQRTKIYHTSLDVQRGLLLGVTYRKVDVTAYIFNLGWTDPTLVLSTGVSF